MKKLEELWFRYFSQATLYTDDAWLRYVVYFVFFITAILGVASDMSGFFTLAKIFFGIFTAEMVIFAVLAIIVYFYHNWRIRHEE